MNSCVRIAFVACVVAFEAPWAHAESWQPAGNLPAAKQHAVGLECGGVLYALGGTPWVNGEDQDPSVFRLVDGAWSIAPELDGVGPTIPMGGGCDALGRIVFFGGISLENGDEGPGRIYNPAEGVQGSIADPPGNVQYLGFAFARDDLGRLYWIGGGEAPDASAFCARYSATTDSWSALAPLPLAVRDACACYDGAGRILVLGGVPAGNTEPTAEVQVYDIAAGTWSTSVAPNLPTPIRGARAVLGADLRIYLLGGLDSNGTVRSAVEVLDPTTNSWTAGPALASPRHEFAAVLGLDDFIYAIGGTGAEGQALSSVERLFTPSCPEIVGAATSLALWTGQTATMAAVVTGGATIDYSWTHDGVPLRDGPTGSGSVISGATTALLTIANTGLADAGSYDVTASNGCGAITGAVSVLDISAPPAMPRQWTVTNLHPAWAKSSSLTCVSGARQGGTATIDTPDYANMGQATIWSGTAESAQNVTPSNSPGAGISDMDGDIAVGWWWWPYQCYVSGQWYTCHTKQAAKWTGAPPVFTNLQWSGWEYSGATVVHNGVVGGSVTTDDASGNVWWHALLWGFNGYSGFDLHPAGASSSSITALDDTHQFGTILTPYPGPTHHAAMWSGTPASLVDLHPVGAVTSFVTDAADGVVVGSTGYPYDGARACMWTSSPQSHVDLHPQGASLSHASITRKGIILGDATFDGSVQFGYWSLGSPGFTELGSLLTSADYSSISIADLQIDDDGTFTLVGSGYHLAHARTEALMWTSSAAVFGDLDGDGTVDGADLGLLLSLWGTGDPVADLDGSGVVDGADLGLLLGAWTG